MFDAGSVVATLELQRTPFTRGLELARKEAAAFEREKHEVHFDAELDGVPEARAEAEKLQKQIDGLEASPNVGLDTTKARAELAALNARLAELDHKDVTVDVNVRRDLASRFGAVTTEIRKLGTSSQTTDRNLNTLGNRGTFVGRAFSGLMALGGRLRGMLGGLGGSASDAGGSFGGLGTKVGEAASFMGKWAAIIIGVVPLVVALAAAVAALVASLAAAAAGAAALAVAFGALFVPAIVLAIGVIKSFQSATGKTRTSITELGQVFKRFGEVVEKALGPGIRAAIDGMRAGLRLLIPLVHSIGPAFTVFGRAVGQAFRILGREFSDPAWQHFFAFLFRAAARVTPVLTRTFIAFARILRNIAQAAMPFLIRGLRDFSHWLGQVANGTRDINLSGVIAQLGAWLELSKQLGRVFLGFITALAPQGKGLVGWLTQGAKALADWVNSARGQAAIKQFFADVLPLAKEIAIFVGRLTLGIIKLGQLMAPILTPLVHLLNTVLGFANKVLDVLNSPGGRTFLNAARDAVTALTNPLELVRQHLSGIGDIARTVFGAIATGARGAVHGVTAAWNGLKGAAHTVWAAVRGIVVGAARGIAHGVSAAFHAMLDAARTIWNTIRGAIATAIHAALDVVRTVLRAMASVAKAVWGAIRDTARTVWGTIKGVVSNAIHGTLDVIRNVIGTIKGVLHDAWQAIKGAAHDAWGTIKDAITAPIQAAAGVIQDVVNTIIDILNKIPGVDLGHISIVGGGDGHHVPNRPGHTHRARGGLVTTPSYMVGEEAPQHPEVILATNPAYRMRNLSLWMKAGHMLGVPGFALGGIGGAGFGPGGAGGVSLPSPGALIGDVKDAVGRLPGWLSGLGSWIVKQLGSFIKDKLAGLLGGGGVTALALKGLTGGSVASIFAAVVKALHAPFKAALALFEAGIVESGLKNLPFGDADSTGALQVRASTAAGLGIDPMNVAQVAGAFLTRGFWGKGGAIALSKTGLSAGAIAQLVQGSAFPSRYAQVASQALAVMRTVGLAHGARNFPGGLALVGEEGPELAVLPRRADVIPAGPTRELLDPINEGLRRTTGAGAAEPTIVINQHNNIVYPADSKTLRDIAGMTAKGVALQGYRSSPRRALGA